MSDLESYKDGFKKGFLKFTGITHGLSSLFSRDNGYFYKKCLQQELNENEFKFRLSSLMAELCPRLQHRAAIYRIDSGCIDGMLADIQEDMLYQFERWTNDEYLAFVKMRFESMLREEGPHHRDRSLKLQKMISDIESMDSIRICCHNSYFWQNRTCSAHRQIRLFFGSYMECLRFENCTWINPGYRFSY